MRLSSGRPTLKDVARECGVSTATVSRVLNMPDQVRSKTRERVEAGIATLGYTPHFGGRALALNRTNTIGAIIPSMENAIFARALQALEELLAQARNTLLIATSGYDLDREAEQIRALLARSVDGIALIGESRSQDVYDLLDAHRLPYVLMWTWRADSPHPCVGFDNRAAEREMVERVIRAGHTRLAMISGLTEDNDRARQRREGFRDALNGHGIDAGAAPVIETHYGLDEGAAAARDLLALPDPPTAIICGNDVLAAGAIAGVNAIGRSVPESVSVVGFDNVELARVVNPGLTTVHVPHRRIGREAARILLEMIGGERGPQRVQLETRLVERQSLASAS